MNKPDWDDRSQGKITEAQKAHRWYRWSKEEDDLLRQNYSHKPIGWFRNRIDKPIRAIFARASRLGLKRGKDERSDDDIIMDDLGYCPVTGIFSWLADGPGRFKRVGAVAGRVKENGYRQIKVGQRELYAHRIAHFIMTGEWPSEEVDHINGERDDNRWENLRAASCQENRWNSRPSKKRFKHSPYKGVNKDGNKWVAQIRIDGRQVRIGRFDTDIEAAEAYKAKAIEVRGKFARWGFGEDNNAERP